MSARHAIIAMLSAVAVCTGVLVGHSARVSLAATDDQILHLIVEQKSDLDSQPRVIEYWLDEQRQLAKSVETTTLGTHTNASGPTWFLQVPPRGRASYLQTLSASGPVRSVWASLYYLRDALKAGAAQTLAIDANTTVVRLGRRNGAFETATGLPVWDMADGTRTEYLYQLREQLPASAFPPSFFRDMQRRELMRTLETTGAGAAVLASVALRGAPSEIAGRPLAQTIVTLNPSDLTREQVTYAYADITVTISLLAREPRLLRPGGTAVSTALGPGLAFSDGGRAQIMVVEGTRATNVHAPDAATALAAAATVAAAR